MLERLTDSEGRAEWRRGWRIVAGAMIVSGLGIPLFYYVFSIFSDGIRAEFNVTHGELSNVQALLVIGALSAPLIGRMLDRYGFRLVFGLSTILITAAHIANATIVNSFGAFALLALVYGVAGVGAGPLAFTRPINAWFLHSRGLALGLAAVGLALTTLFGAPLLAALVAAHGWQSGFIVLAIVGGCIALPLSLWLVRDAPPGGDPGTSAVLPGSGDRSFMRERDFWLLALSMICMASPGAGLVSQASPLLQEEGLGPQAAALGISGYALGQLTGRIVAGWFLDHADPRKVAFFFTIVPAIGFVVLAAFPLPFAAALVAVGMVGVQQGAEIDLFAYFVARRFGLARYGQIYGWIIAVSWLANAGGIILFGRLYDATGTYAMAEAIAAMLLAGGAILIAMVRINGSSQSFPEHPPAP